MRPYYEGKSQPQEKITGDLGANSIKNPSPQYSASSYPQLATAPWQQWRFPHSLVEKDLLETVGDLAPDPRHQSLKTKGRIYEFPDINQLRLSPEFRPRLSRSQRWLPDGPLDCPRSSRGKTHTAQLAPKASEQPSMHDVAKSPGHNFGNPPMKEKKLPQTLPRDFACLQPRSLRQRG
jgi:hypothetical protein